MQNLVQYDNTAWEEIEENKQSIETVTNIHI